MKKFLLMLLLLICLKGYSADIDVGSLDAGIVTLADFTFINKTNPSNDTGTIDLITYRGHTTPTTVDVASFADEGSNVFSTNGTGSISYSGSSADETFYAPGDFTAFDINSGEYIGAYNLSSHKLASTGFLGVWYTTSDDIPADSVTFIFAAGYGMVLYAEGTIAPPPARRIIMISQAK